MLPIDEALHLLKKESQFTVYENGRLRIQHEGHTILDRPYKEEPDILTLEDVGCVELFINGGMENITSYIC